MGEHALAEDAQSVVDEAMQIAMKYHHEDIDSVHLLYSVLNHSKPGQVLLKRLGAQRTKSVLSECESRLLTDRSRGEYPEPSTKFLRIMRSAEIICANEGQDLITPRHLLMAIFEQDDDLTKLIPGKPGEYVQIGYVSSTPALDEVSRDLTLLAREGRLSPVIGRETEIEQLIEVLIRQGKNSALLLGQAGVGKTAIIEGLAQKVNAREVPNKLHNCRLVELNLASLLAGTTFRGEFEERIQNIIRELEANQGIVLVIDEFHALIGTGKTASGGPDAVSILKPPLARGDITCIGITTSEDFTRYIETDDALVRRFQKVIVEEPTSDTVAEILHSISPSYSEHHNVQISDDILMAVIHLSHQYLPTLRFPDKAIDVLGKACARAELHGIPAISPESVAEIISELSGVPIGNLSINHKEKLAALEKTINQEVIGQEEAVKGVTQAVQMAYLGLRDPRRPMGIFMFVGPSGVGKTELARSLARNLFGNEKALIRFDMSEYAERINMSRLIGSAPGYIGHEEPGQLTQALRDHPHSIILFDEIEKACSDVFDLFLQLFDEGRLTDSHGRLADGRHSFFIMTSNLSISNMETKEGGFGFLGQLKRQSSQQDIRTIKNFFRPELLNRIDQIIYFRSLDEDDLIEIAKLELMRLVARLKEQGIHFTYEGNVLEFLAKVSTEKESGARALKNAIEEHITIPISNYMIHRKGIQENWLHIRISKKNIIQEWL
jgi:ATP-dependent Clp protease ATP-binding subunit ClpC